MPNNKTKAIYWLARHILTVLSIFVILSLIRYPIFINSDHFFTNDEGVLGGKIIDLLNGGPLSFYYDTLPTSQKF